MLTFIRRLLVVAASLCLAVTGLLLLFEKSGMLVRYLERRLAEELGPLAERVSIEGATLRWFEPALVLEGIGLAAENGAEPDVLLERVRITFTPHLDGLLALRSEGGRMLLGQRLFEDWDRFVAWRQALTTPPALGTRLPFAELTGLRVSLELVDRSSFELGSIDLRARADVAGYEVAGHLQPTLGGALVAPQPILLKGALTGEGARLWASARDVALESRALPAPTLLRSLPVAECSARLTLDSTFELAFADAARPRGTLRASLINGRLLAVPGRPALENLDLEIAADLLSTADAGPWTREAWAARASFRARTGGTPLSGWVEFGRDVPDGRWLRGFGRAHDMPLERDALEAFGVEGPMAFARAMLDPRGHVDVEASLLASWTGASWSRDFLVHVLSSGGMGLTYLGFPGDEGSGIPLPISAVRGELLFAQQDGHTRPWRLAGIDLTASRGDDRLEGWMQLTAPARTPNAFPQAEFDLVLASPSVAVEGTLLQALGKHRHLDWLQPTFAPEGGTLAADLRLRGGPELSGLSGALRLGLHGLAMRWSEVPVPLERLDGELAVLWAARPTPVPGSATGTERAFGVRYSLDNRREPRVGAQAGVRGWVREDEPLPGSAGAEALPLYQEIEIDIDDLGLRGRDFDVLAARFEALEREVQDYGALGRVRVRYRGTQAPGGPYTSLIEATPLEVIVKPQFFQKQTRDLRGRILIRSEEHEVDEDSATFVLSGSWPGGVELFARGAIPVHGDARVLVYGAGIDPTNTSFKGALITTLTTGPQPSQGIDLSSWTLAGPIDFAMETTFDPASEAPAKNRFRIQLRDNDLDARDLELHDLHGTFEQVDEVLRGPLVHATLGGHPLELRNVRMFPLYALDRVDDADPWLRREGFWKDVNGRAIQADLFASGLPLDADTMSGLLEPEAVEALRRNESWRGVLDVLGARVVVTAEFDNEGKVALRGRLRPRDLGMRLGLPITVETADVLLEELVLESERFRGWAHIQGLNAHIAERKLTDASMIASYVDGRLTIDNLSGDFEQGRLESLGGAGGGASKALGVDLSEPYRFDVAMRLAKVGVAGLLQGVFQSSIADEGILDATLQLSGTPGEVRALTGRGSLNLDEGSLWSIPVMRELFLQLGFERTGLFDRLRARYEVRDGRIAISHLEIQSSLLDLVGAGWQDLDGTLSYDLEVRYGLLDKLGPLSRVFYWLNNNLWRVAVRGDFDRPKVSIRNAILELVKGFDDEPPRQLPMPRFSALQRRF